MRMLLGIFLCSLGVSCLFIASLFSGPGVWILSIIFLIAGVIVVYYAYKRGQRDKAAHLIGNSKIQCPVCHINLADDCRRCPRCGKEF